MLHALSTVHSDSELPDIALSSSGEIKKDEKLEIIGLMAATESGVIGKGEGLPWNYPSEMKHFLDTSANGYLIMGRKTFESTPIHVFYTRTPIVFTRQQYNINNGHIVHSLEECKRLLSKLAPEGRKFYMIGGKEIAELFLKEKLITKFILTTIKNEHEGDCKLDMSFFKDRQSKVLKDTDDYIITEINF